MARKRNPKLEEAYRLWIESTKTKLLKDIADNQESLAPPSENGHLKIIGTLKRNGALRMKKSVTIEYYVQVPRNQ